MYEIKLKEMRRKCLKVPFIKTFNLLSLQIQRVNSLRPIIIIFSCSKLFKKMSYYSAH